MEPDVSDAVGAWTVSSQCKDGRKTKPERTRYSTITRITYTESAGGLKSRFLCQFFGLFNFRIFCIPPARGQRFLDNFSSQNSSNWQIFFYVLTL